MNDQLIFKILSKEEWAKAIAEGTFRGSAVDLADGFIHFSSQEQLAETAAKHFAGKADLLLVSVNTGELGDDLKWEPSRGGDLFPHLYGDLKVALAVGVREFEWNESSSD